MTMRTAHYLWGEEAVAVALAEPDPDPVTDELLKAIKARKDPPGAFRAWALAQSWPRFCTIVRIVSGEIRREVMRHGDQDEDEDDDPEA
ncbi:MAG: hypothetical protein IT374_24205 [Polyangiaceae bacterium]|nr:hypothetical protein [Polyangiaceae bacterium]